MSTASRFLNKSKSSSITLLVKVLLLVPHVYPFLILLLFSLQLAVYKDRVKTKKFRSLLVHKYNFKSQCINKSIINIMGTKKVKNWQWSVLHHLSARYVYMHSISKSHAYLPKWRTISNTSYHGTQMKDVFLCHVWRLISIIGYFIEIVLVK